MSLLIIGSTSKVTQNIVLKLSKRSIYKHITISDLLPSYHLHQRYYQLRQNLAQNKSSLSLSLNKITRLQQLNTQINSHQDILFVTHDYFQFVTSKTKLMELTAQLSKKKANVVFAAPLQYDHFGYTDPYQNFFISQQKVQAINPNASFIRSDIQDNTQVISYVKKSKGFLQDIYWSVPETFKPALVSGQTYAQTVADTLQHKKRGQIINLNGQNFIDLKGVQITSQVINLQTRHFCPNIYNLLKKYRGLPKLASSTA